MKFLLKVIKSLRMKSFLLLLKLNQDLFLSPKTLENDVEELQKVYKNSGRILARIQPKIINLSDNRVDLIFEIYEG